MAVSPDDVAVTLGRTLSSPEQDQAQQWIGDAMLLISVRAQRERTTVSSLDQAVVDMVVREAVAARLKKPDAAKQVSIQVDDGQVSKTYEAATGQIEITADWWELLFPSGQSEAFSIPLAYQHPHHHPRPPLSQPFWDVNL